MAVAGSSAGPSVAPKMSHYSHCSRRQSGRSAVNGGPLVSQGACGLLHVTCLFFCLVTCFFFAVALANRQDIFGLECQKVDGAGAGGVTTVSFTGDDLSPFVDSVGEMLEKNLRPNSDDIAIQPERDTTGEWFDCDELFEDFWVTCFHTEPYYGDTKGKRKANPKPRYNTVVCGRRVPAGVGHLSGRYLDPCPLLHDVGAWGNLEDFLVVCGAVEMKWQQGGESWLEPGKHGTMLVRFESDGSKCVCIVWCLCVPFVPTSTYIVLQKVRSSFRVVARGVRLVRPMVPGACGPGQEEAEQKLRAEPVRLQLRRVRPGQGAPARGACVHVQRPRERRREEVRSRGRKDTRGGQSQWVENPADVQGVHVEPDANPVERG